MPAGFTEVKPTSTTEEKTSFFEICPIAGG
jgi:hypothetical protein